MTAMINAMRVLTDPADTGAVTIALPQDVQGEVYDFPGYFFKIVFIELNVAFRFQWILKMLLS
jgi:TPP-dependent trihydroxycyclohexane-1,2-dione (THcHDO) dehydratase